MNNGLNEATINEAPFELLETLELNGAALNMVSLVGEDAAAIGSGPPLSTNPFYYWRRRRLA